MAAPTTLTYRKNRAGQWVVFGPVAQFGTSSWVTVTKRDGTTRRECVTETGRPFDVDGVQCCYGYPGQREDSQPSSQGREMCAECGQRAGVQECRDSSGIVARCCHRCAALPEYERSFA